MSLARKEHALVAIGSFLRIEVRTVSDRLHYLASDKLGLKRLALSIGQANQISG